MDITIFEHKIEIPPDGRSTSYINQYNNFWAWKINVEQQNDSHILDSKHINDTCERLLGILPRWQTYRGVKCNFEKELPLALTTIADAYNMIRQYSLLEFQQIPDKPLRLIWDTLGRIKEKHGISRTNTECFIIAVCKPLMFIWGQTLAFDSINRINIRKDNTLMVTKTHLGTSRWPYLYWKNLMLDFQRELLKAPDIVNYCQKHSKQVFATNLIVPYGRYLDLYYYY